MGSRMKNWLWLLSLFLLMGCSSNQHDLYFPQGEREVLGLQAFQSCGHENYQVLKEGRAGPYDHALIECGEHPR